MDTEAATGSIGGAIPPVDIRILGPVRVVEHGGRSRTVPSAPQRRLLAVLAVHSPRPLRAEYLSQLLEVSTGALRTTVSRLRRILGEEVLRTDAHGYSLEAGIDAVRFTELLAKPPAAAHRLEQLDAALAHWHGEALDEFRHEAWALSEVARLDELRSLAIEAKAALLITSGRAGEAIVTLEPHITSFPLRDEPRGLLMRALADQGRQAEALRVYDGYRRYLAEEVGTEPSADVRAIERRIASGSDTDHDFARRRDAGLGGGAPRQASSFPLPSSLRAPDGFVGRREHIEWLDAQLSDVVSGSARVALLAGEPGVGKTAIVSAWIRDSGSDERVIVACGRCIEGDAVPLQPLREVVAYLVEHLPLDLLAEHVARHGGELVRLGPQLRRRLPDVPPPTHADTATERQLLFEAVGDLVRTVASVRPTIVVIEDLHWAEPTTLRLVRHLVGDLGNVPVMVLATRRDSDPDDAQDLRATLADLARSPATRTRHIEGLASAELAALVTNLIGAPNDDDRGHADLKALEMRAFVDELVLATAGNPLFATQLVRHLAESGHLEVHGNVVRYEPTTETPPDVRAIVWQRVSLLGEDAAEVLATGAALGVEFDVEVLANMIDIPERRFTRVIDAAVRAGLLSDGTSPRTMRFTHAVVAQALYGELRGVTRNRVHERAARILIKSAGEHPQRIAVQLARHWELAGDIPEALTWSVAAGDAAMHELAAAEAARWYAAAADHAQTIPTSDATRAEITIKLGDAQRRAGRPEARATLLHAAELSQRAGARDALVRAALLNTRGFQSATYADPDRIEVIEAALAVVDRDDEAATAQLLALLGQELINTPQSTRRLATASEAVAIARASSDPMLLARIAPAAMNALWEPGSSPLRSQLADDAIARVARIDDPLLELRIHVVAYDAAIEAADAPAARRSLQRIRQLTHRLGEPHARWVLGMVEVFEHTVAGNLDEAEALNDANFALGTEIGEDDAFIIFAGQFYQYRSFAWRIEELFPVVEEAAASGSLPFKLAYGIQCARFSRVPEAQVILDEAAQVDFTNVANDWHWSTSMMGYAVLANEIKDVAAAELLIDRLAPYAAQNVFNGATSQGCIGANVGRLLSVVGDYATAEQYLQDSIEVHTAFGWLYFRATGLAALAENRRRWMGELDAFARECIAEAEAIARPRGLYGALEQIKWATVGSND